MLYAGKAFRVHLFFSMMTSYAMMPVLYLLELICVVSTKRAIEVEMYDEKCGALFPSRFVGNWHGRRQSAQGSVVALSHQGGLGNIAD